MNEYLGMKTGTRLQETYVRSNDPVRGGSILKVWVPSCSFSFCFYIKMEAREEDLLEISLQ
jgi:hypothetical protein